MPKTTSRPKQADLLEAMRKRKWRQQDLALHLRISLVTLNHWLNFRSLPKEFSDEVEVKLRQLTGKTSAELFPMSVRGAADFLTDEELDDTRESLAGVPAERFVQEGLIQKPHSPEASVLRRELRDLVFEVLATLTPREQKVIRLRFGLNEEGEDHTLEEVAEQFGVCRERIRAIEANALRHLRHPSRSRRLRSFWLGRSE